MVNLREYFRELNAIEDVHEEAAIDATLEAWEAIKNDNPIFTHSRIETDGLEESSISDTVGC